MIPLRRTIVVALALVSILLPTVARGQTPPSVVTLKASTDHIRYGQSVRFFGKVDPAMNRQQVDILDSDGDIRATAETGADGRYETMLRPSDNDSYRAESNGVPSDQVHVRVQPLLNVHLGRVRLFDRATARGRIRPGHHGGSMRLRLKRGGNTVAHRDIRLDGSWFKTHFKINKPGTYRVVASFDDHDHLAVADSSEGQTTPLPRLSAGSHGPYVERLERRLRQLGYHLDGVNKRFTYKTSDAVIAFNKVQGHARVTYVDAGTWRALADPVIPHPRFSSPRYHIEVDQTKQVLYVVKADKVIHILHVSTGAGSATRDGTFDFDRKLAGYSPHRLYYPSYFDGARAIHGWPDVPPTNASHGCVRVPMWAATWIYGLVDIGDIIKIYH
ncbi:MAG TPA: L,D-transpeptidase family protein [Actinomycetota bacterium]|nr:L,D-transpeptidase family protein [Actinomycetota bacterium]